ncbi:sugar ABC transporter permease [Paenibacillus sp. J5C_2022]|uniref:carbohydrate ABC transporter permease n=1 Tax=Paenibacillus sp. J5C2022 TaxID=2977129 RepID=UPI0021D25648|nr:sugar ABC transporter permease [Paenibacillus sp. J5C2022]MCU6712942.1 sugar ABC transporter permease [Paenibacillus sp. J5C2022]
MHRKEHVVGYLFLAPSLIGFAVFLLFPIVFSFVLAFSEWDLVSGLKAITFIGLNNFSEMWSDEWFRVSLKNNFILTALVVPITMIVSLAIAIVLNDKVYGKNMLRLVYFMPYITTIVAAAVVWMALYHPSQGPINQLLLSLGVDNPPKWLASPTMALPSIAIMMIWAGIGFDLIVYMAALQGIPKHLYEAADLDGATGLRRFFHITLPMLSPTTFFLFITRIIHSFEVFTPINIMTEGGPGDATSVLVYQIYKVSFAFYRLGYGSAIAWVLFVIIFIITLIQWKYQNKWVTYN